MKVNDIIRAWKDPDYRASLAAAPESPAGLVELDDVALEGILGGSYEIEDSFGTTKDTSTCMVSGERNSCGWKCTVTTECGC